ncbi:hypothetical protein BT96DRAFT_981110 [Gymnopus androsaceus JB14]|uniref:Uncharacterized protein n=1 Tax=Gymnopus androsaceus JB14 TaxID=1447944 RepID=A0A6A4GR77_9AGAR|nr:hypothetical protein BT96DRAFT_981110 [Gymnopus androsaceus JB14]
MSCSTQWLPTAYNGRNKAGAESLPRMSPNPKMEATEAVESMSPLIELGKKLQKEKVEGVQVITTRECYEGLGLITAGTQMTGVSMAIASLLIPKANFATTDSQAELVEGLVSANIIASGVIILITHPLLSPFHFGKRTIRGF